MNFEEIFMICYLIVFFGTIPSIVFYEYVKKKRTEKSASKKKKGGGLLANSPINYFSDLFIMAMVVAWIATIVIMIIMGIYATIVLHDTSLWPDVVTLVTVPLSAGGAIWMIKNGVQHAIANYKGERAQMDFPKVNAEGENDGIEEG